MLSKVQSLLLKLLTKTIEPLLHNVMLVQFAKKSYKGNIIKVISTNYYEGICKETGKSDCLKSATKKF